MGLQKTTYFQVGFHGVLYYAHRICWFLGTGEWPSDQIDHINGNGLDNRLENLRVVSNQENNKNQTLRVNSSSGVTGVHWDKISRKWVAQIKLNGRSTYIGSFSDKDDAVKARKRADKEHGFHKNHGRVSEG